jgi:hypothetical protein
MDNILPKTNLCRVILGCCPGLITRDDDIIAILFRRKILQDTQIPFMLFCIAFASFSIQITIPLSNQDAENMLLLDGYKSVFPKRGPCGNTTYTLADFSSSQTILDTPIAWKF